MRCGLTKDLARRIIGIGCDNFWEEACNFRHAKLASGPCCDDFRNRLQSETVGYTLRELARRLRIDGSQGCPHGFAADPESAAFITKVRPPTADSKHRAFLVAANLDRPRARDSQNSRIDADRADGSDECI